MMTVLDSYPPEVLFLAGAALGGIIGEASSAFSGNGIPERFITPAAILVARTARATTSCAFSISVSPYLLANGHFEFIQSADHKSVILLGSAAIAFLAWSIIGAIEPMRGRLAERLLRKRRANRRRHPATKVSNPDPPRHSSQHR